MEIKKRRCSKCSVEYERTTKFFYSAKQMSDKLSPQCKLCAASYSKPKKDTGRVKHSWSIRKRLAHYSKLNKKTKCLEWTSMLDSHGYGRLGLWNKIYSAARLSFEVKYGPIADGMCVLHKCDNPLCIKPSHLFLGTKLDNTRDMMRKGRQRFAGKSYGKIKTKGEKCV